MLGSCCCSSALRRMYSVLPSQTSLALDWLKGVDRLDPGQGGQIPLCAAVLSSLGLASHPTLVLLVLLVLLAGLLRSSPHRAEPSEPTKGDNAPRASIGLSLLLHSSYRGINGTCLVGVKLLVVRKPNVPRDCLGGLWQQVARQSGVLHSTCSILYLARINVGEGYFAQLRSTTLYANSLTVFDGPRDIFARLMVVVFL